MDEEQAVPRQYEKRDLEAAIKASGISAAAAVRVMRHLYNPTSHPPSRDEASDVRFSYTGKSILTAVGLLLLLTGLMIVARSMIASFAGLLVAAIAFTLSAHFQRRGEGIPLAVLLAGSVFGMADTLLGLAASFNPGIASGAPVEPWHSAIVCGGAAIAAGAFWLVYRLPLALATFMVIILILGGELVTIIVQSPSTWNFVIWPTVFAILALALACWHDMSDVYRETMRSDVAFWLHGVGGITIAGQFFLLYQTFAHPAPSIPTSIEQITTISPAASCIAMIIFLTYLTYAILLDRLSMALIGSLFVMLALHSALGLDLFAMSLIISGAVTLALAAMWQPIRHLALAGLPLIVRAQLRR